MLNYCRIGRVLYCRTAPPSWSYRQRHLSVSTSLRSQIDMFNRKRELEITANESTSSAIYQLNSLLRYATDLLRCAKEYPLFIIDDANRLKTLLKDEDGQAALKSLFNWFVYHTKEQNFHTVLISSDSTSFLLNGLNSL